MAFWDRFRRDRQEERRLDGLSVPSWSDVSTGAVSLVGGSEARTLSLVPVFSSCRLLAGTVSTLPLKTYRDVDGEKTLAPQAQLFLNLEKAGTLTSWLHACVTSLALHGNAYGEIVDRDGYGYPTQIEWHDPSLVHWENTEKGVGWRMGNRLYPENSILHIPWFTLPGRKEGLSPIRAFATTIHGGLEAERFGLDWFAAGGFPPGTFQNKDQIVDQEVATVMKARVGAAIRSRQPLVYGKDWEYKPISVPPNEAQFIQAQKLTATQIAAIYGIPPEMIGGETGKSMTYANVEQHQIQFVTMTLRPWLVVLERAFTAQLPAAQYVKFNADALIRTDTLTRHEIYSIDRAIGLRSLDEIRALEDLPSLPNGEGTSYAPPVAPPTAIPKPLPAPNVRSLWQRPA